MPGYERITRCLELTDADIDKAVTSRSETKALIHQLASIARPNDGAPKILLLFARLALGNSDWMDGYLHIEITGDDRTSAIEVMTELGAGMRERLLPAIQLKVPLAEFARSLERVPHMIQPLYVHSLAPPRLVVSALPPTSDSQDYGRPISVISTPVGSPSGQPAPLPVVAALPIPDFASKPPDPPLKPEDSAPTRPFSPAVLLAEEAATKPISLTPQQVATRASTPAPSMAPTKPMSKPALVEPLEPTRENKPAPAPAPRPILPPKLSQRGPSGWPATEAAAASRPPAPRPPSSQKAPAIRQAPRPARRDVNPFSSPTVPRMTAVRPDAGARDNANDSGDKGGRGEPANSRPTVPPPFDMKEFARKRTGNVKVPELPTVRPPTLDPAAIAALYDESSFPPGEEALLARIGALDRVPRIVGGIAQISALSRDRSTAFLLSQIDGVSTLEMIVDVSGMPRHDALRILVGLMDGGTILVD